MTFARAMATQYMNSMKRENSMPVSADGHAFRKKGQMK